MALIVGTDSFATMAELDTYWFARNGQTWLNATLPVKEKAAREATQYLVGEFDGLWIGRHPGSSSQVLPWPRNNARDNEGRWITGIPSRVKHAQAELAMEALSVRLMPASVEDREGIVSESIGDASVSYSHPVHVHKRYTWTRLLLRGLLKGGRGSSSLLRV